MTAFMESIIRPFTTVVSTPKPRPMTPPVEDQPEAFIEWGAPSEFEDNSFRDVASTPGFQVEDPPSANLILVEQARTYTDFKFTNPEDDSQFVILRKTDEIAFSDNQGRQHRMAFDNAYTAEANVPSYLKNTAGEEFEPLVLDPFHTVVEVGWTGGFVVIAVQVKPHTACEFAVAVANPVDNKGILAPGFEQGDPPLPTPEDAPFMRKDAGLSIVDDDGAFVHFPEEAQGMGPPIDLTPPVGIKSLRFSNGGNAMVWRTTTEFMGYTMSLGETVVSPTQTLCEGVPPEGTWVRGDDQQVQDAPGCFSHGANDLISVEYPPPEATYVMPYMIPQMPGDGEIVYPEPDEEGHIGRGYQWKLDVGVEQNPTPVGNTEITTTTGILFLTDTLDGTPYPHGVYYRRWHAAYDAPYDPGPFVYALFFVDVALLRKFLGPELALQGSNNELQISVLAGEADDPSDSSGESNQFPEGATFDPAQGRIRWSWHAGSAREAYDAFVAALPQYSEDNVPSYDEVWEDIHFTEGLLNEQEDDFPAGSFLEDALRERKRYRVVFGESSLIEDV